MQALCGLAAPATLALRYGQAPPATPSATRRAFIVFSPPAPLDQQSTHRPPSDRHGEPGAPQQPAAAPGRGRGACSSLGARAGRRCSQAAAWGAGCAAEAEGAQGLRLCGPPRAPPSPAARAAKYDRSAQQAAARVASSTPTRPRGTAGPARSPPGSGSKPQPLSAARRLVTGVATQPPTAALSLLRGASRAAGPLQALSLGRQGGGPRHCGSLCRGGRQRAQGERRLLCALRPARLLCPPPQCGRDLPAPSRALRALLPPPLLLPARRAPSTWIRTGTKAWAASRARGTTRRRRPSACTRLSG